MMWNSWSEFILEYIKNSPFVKLQDVYKLVFQAHFGPKHFIDTVGDIQKTVNMVWKSDSEREGLAFEPISPDSCVLRAHIGPYKLSGGSFVDLINVVDETVNQINRTIDLDTFYRNWLEVQKALLSTKTFDEISFQKINEKALQRPPLPIHHSEIFRVKTDPHYIVVSREAIERIGSGILKLFSHGKSRIVGLPDVQNEKPLNQLPIDRVGIKDLSYPITVLDRENSSQNTVADVAMSVELPSHWRGTHMSRFIEILNKFRGEITSVQIEAILKEMIDKFEAKAAYITLLFPYFLEKKAPISGAKSLMEYIAIFDGRFNLDGFRFELGVRVPVHTLCPCSKEISEHGAHNQRGYIEISIVSKSFIWIEDLIGIAEKASSSPVYSLLKRQDEKEITEKAYNKPEFVEDVVRAIAKELYIIDDIISFDITATSMESIHNHNAFARIKSK